MTLQDIIKNGLALGLEEVEVYVSTSESNSLKLNDGELDAYNMKEIFGVSKEVTFSTNCFKTVLTLSSSKVSV